MLTGMELMACPNLAVPAEVMHHVVNVESGYNPYAIGVVGGQLVRQPQNLDEALATVQMLESKGYNFSVGVAQVNRSNLLKYGLDSYQKAFDPCENLAVGSQILNGCYYSSGGDWGKAFSCYYSGNFVTGFRDGYVQKIYDSMNRGMTLASNTSVDASSAIPLQSVPVQVTKRSNGTTVLSADSSAYRVAIRSSLVDAVANAALTPVVNAIAPSLQAAPAPAAAPAQPPPVQAQASAAAPAAPQAAGNNNMGDVFIPQVRGPGDPVGPAPRMVAATAGAAQAAANPAAAPGPATAAAPAAPAAPAGDHADLRQGGQDNAFVF